MHLGIWGAGGGRSEEGGGRRRGSGDLWGFASKLKRQALATQVFKALTPSPKPTAATRTWVGPYAKVKNLEYCAASQHDKGQTLHLNIVIVTFIIKSYARTAHNSCQFSFTHIRDSRSA